MTGGWHVRDLGRAPYETARRLQRELVDDRLADRVDDTLLVCEHDPVVTVGRGTPDGPPPADRFPVVEVERGGQATYHGPGQVVVYPIVKLAEDRRDLHRWMRALEQACIEALGTFGLDAARRDGATGVWVAGERKIVSIGVAASRWVTWHGLALNLDPDLDHFGAIQPCGFDASVMTSLAVELGDRCPTRAVLVEELLERLRTVLAPFRAACPAATSAGEPCR